MKVFYVAILVVVEILILFTIIKSLKKKGKSISLSQKIRDMLLSAFFTVLPNIFLVNTLSYLTATILFSWYFCFIDILLFFVLYFSAEYTLPGTIASRRWTRALYLFFRYDIAALFKKEKQKQKTTWFEKMMLFFLLVIIADIVSFVFNIFTHKVFTVESFYYTGTFFSSDIYFRIVSYFPYDMHLSLSYMLVLLFLGFMLHKTFFTPSLYRIKYLGVIFLVSLIVITNSFYILFELPVDFSVMLYGLVVVCIYYFSFNYIPHYLRRETINRVVNNMQNGILIFDNDDNCILVNDYIRKVYNISLEQEGEEALKPLINKISNGKPLCEREPYEETIRTEVDGKDIYHRVTFSRIESKSHKYIGSYFLLVDTSDENRREKLEHFRNTHDALTGLYNKEFFYERVAEHLEANPDGQYCILCSDIGNFKLINELYGVVIGDKILKLVARDLREKSVSDEIYGRIDNDRFAMLIPKERLNLQVFIDSIDKIFKKAVDFATVPVCYFGVYEIEDPTMRISFMCDRAFIAIDTIKGQFGKQVAWYDSTLRNNVLREQELVYQISEAISTEQIKIYLQPQSTHDGEVLGAEALVRWEHPDDGLVSPEEFVPVFEKNGMITRVDRYIWNLAFKKVYEWKTSGHEDLYLTLNVSPKDFYLMNIYQEFSELLKEYPVNPKNIHIEIAEPLMIIDLDRQIKLIEQLNGLGFTIEIGDFGAGYSSLKILRECNIEVLKLDVNFLEKTKAPRNAHIILKNFIAMAHNLGIKVLAKGIEKKEQVDLLHNDGCDLFQGYYFSKPLATSMFEKIYL